MSSARKDPAARRAELIEAASACSPSAAWRPPPSSDIVKAAGVAQGTFYLYFESKADVVNAVVATISEHIVDGRRRDRGRPTRPQSTSCCAMRDELLRRSARTVRCSRSSIGRATRRSTTGSAGTSCGASYRRSSG